MISRKLQRAKDTFRQQQIMTSTVQYTLSVSTIILSGPTYSSQNVRQMSDKSESQHSLSSTIWSDILVLVGHFGRT
jgi:cell division protein FtsX